jgi:hypothetical protein
MSSSVWAADPTPGESLLHCESLISLLDIHVIENRCGRIDNHIEAQRFTQTDAAPQQENRSYPMFANAMSFIDRAAMSVVLVLAAMPILSIAARATFL